MTVVLTYFIGKTLWDEDTGFYAGAFLLGIPYLFTQVPLMLVDVPTMFFLTLLIFTFIKALSQGGVKMIAFASFTLFLTFFSKYSTWLMLSVLVIIFLVYLIQGSGVRSKRLYAKTSSEGQDEKSRGDIVPLRESGVRYHIVYRMALIFLIAGFFIGVVALFKFDVISDQIRLLLDYQRPGLKRWGESFVSTFFYQIHPFITIVSLYSIYVAFRKRDLRYVIVSWLILLVVLLQIKRIRYIMVLFPMFALMASYGVQEIKNKELRRFLVSCAVISSLVIAIFIYLPFLQRMSPANLKSAGRFLNSIDAANIEVLTIPSTNYVINSAVSVPILDLYTEKDIFYYYDASFSPPFERIKESSLRFTWEYKNPEYYSPHVKGLGEDTVVVVISSELRQSIPEHIAQRTEGFQISKIFKNSIGVFKYVTIVRVYQQ
jgi:hypothetical protein